MLSVNLPLPRSRPRRAALALLLCGAVGAGLLTGAAHAGGPTSPEPPLDRALTGLIAMPGGPPGAIAVLRVDGRTTVHRAGEAEIGTARLPEATDHMRLASVAKAYSGAVALGLVSRGALGLDDTLAERLPALPAAWGAVTLRQLLNHTSGLPDFTASPALRDLLTEDPRREFDPRRLLDLVAGQDLLFPPGSRYAYSNSDNIAVALMAEAVTGRTYEDLLGTYVLSPLGLRGTGLPPGHRMPVPYLHGYDVEPASPPEDVSEILGTSSVWASGGIVSTPAELGTFVRAYAGGQLVAPQVHAAQLETVNGESQPAGPGRNDAGLAIFRYTTRCGVVYGHTGNFPGYTQLAAATADGRRSLTFSITTQVGPNSDPALLERLRAVQEDFVCALLNS